MTEKGRGGRRSGAIGKDIILEVPLGTAAKNAETGEQLFEITEDGQEIILLKGGRGGMGNDHFKSATNQTPQYAQPGEPGQEEWFVLELKVLADVGLVGFPNAGKSTLLSGQYRLPGLEIADYPFTTLVPNLGVVSYRDYKSFVMADIPGIIEGASQERDLVYVSYATLNEILFCLFMVPADSEDIAAEYVTLVQELRIYNPTLLDKNRILAISKMDVLSEDERVTLRQKSTEWRPNSL